MKITLKKLVLVNFKGIKSLEIDFAEETKISGRNATGKSTVFDAFTWVLFGKDAQNRKDFGIKTYDEHGVTIHKLDHEVHAILDIDGVETKLSSILKEKWVKKRGEETAEYTGNENLYFVNDVPYQAGEYQRYISNIIPEQTFKLLTSPTYFNSLKWSDAREMLISIVGAPTDEEIAGKDLAGLLKIMADEKKTVDQLKKEYAAKKKVLKDELSQIPSRIDEVTRATPQAQDWKKIAGDIATNKLEVAVIGQEIADKSKGVEQAVRLRSEMLIESSNLQQKLQKFEYQARQEFSTMSNTKDHEITAKKQKVESLQQSINSWRHEIDTANSRISDLNAQNSELRNKWSAKNAETLEWNEGTTCPTCGQGLPDDMIEHKQKEAEQRFNSSKTAELQTIQKYGTVNKERIDQLKVTVSELTLKIELAEKDIAEIEEYIKTIESRPALTKSVEAILTENEEYLITKQRASEILIPEAIQQPDTTELKERKAGLLESINQLTAILSTKDVIDANDKRKKELEASEKTYAQQIASMEKIEYQIEQFTKRKVTEVEKRVNALFPTVQFKMFKPLINGGEEPDCICLINGVPFGDANNAARINAGVEIINVFSSVHGITAPIFVDNAESVNQITPTNSQIIKLYVTDDKVLTVTI